MFRGQDLTPKQQIEFSRNFGEIELHTLSAYHMTGYPEIFINSNIIKNGKPVGAQKSGRAWHSDSQFLALPSSATILHARQVPDEDGDTLYANMYAAYDALSSDMKRRIAGLYGIYSRVKSWSINYPHRKPLTEKQKAALPEVTHPIVRTHPDTGRKARYIGSVAELVRIKGLSEAEQSLCQELFQWATNARFFYAHRWLKGDVIVWDNRCTMHKANPFDEQRYTRLMHRTTICGAKPVE